MPIQPPDWTECLICPICTQPFSTSFRPPTTLGCGHSICRNCLSTINKKCPFDKETMLKWEPEDLPINYALLQLVTPASSSNDNAIGQNIIRDISPAIIRSFSLNELECYKCAIQCIEELAVSLKPSGTISGLLSRPMQRRIVGLVGCQLLLDNGRLRSVRIARSLGDRAVTELTLQHQNAQQLSSNLWAAVRARGCQFLSPTMQDEALKFVLLALRDGASLSRKDLVMYVLHKLEKTFPQASKTCIGHVVQLLYRASCFKVTKRESDSSLMQLKEEFRTHKMLRREHDAQIIQIAVEAGLRIAPDQWSALLYADYTHKSDMQSLIDQQLTPQSFSVSVEELMLALKRTADPANLPRLRADFNNLADIDPDLTVIPTMQECLTAIISAKNVFNGLINFIQYHGQRKQQESTHVLNPNRYKISLCRDFSSRGSCPRGTNCTFAHSNEELERYRARMRKNTIRGAHPSNECDPSDYVAQSGPSHVAVNISHATKPNQEEVSPRFNKPMPYRNENALHQPLSANPQHLMPAYSGASSSSTPNLSTKLSPNQRKAIPSPMKNNVNSFRFNYNPPANNNDTSSASSVYDRAPPLSAQPITQHAPLFMSQEFKKQFTPYQNAPSAVPQKSNFQMNQGRSHDFNNNNGSADNKYMIDWNQNVKYLGSNVSHDNNHLTASHRMSQPLNDKLIYRNSKNDEDDPWNFPSHVTNGNPPTYNLLEGLKTRQQWSGLQSLPPKPCAAAAADMMGNSNYNAEMTKIPNDNRSSNDLCNRRSQNGQRGSFLDLPISDMQSTSIRPQIPSSTAAAVAKPNVWISLLQNWNKLSKDTTEDTRKGMEHLLDFIHE